MIRVALVDDHPVVLDGLRRAIDTDPELSLVGVAMTLSEARHLIESQLIDVVIVDIRLGDESGLALIRDTQAKPLAPAFLVLSSFDMPQYVDASLRFGAAGFLLKTSPPDSVFSAVKTIATGGLVFEPHLLAKGLAPRPKPLTAREREIVDGVLRGRSNDEIGHELQISRKTVEGHLSKLFGRFGVATRIELAIKAERERWLDVP